MKQTAVEWLFQELDNYYQMEGNVIKKEILNQAKEMEKQQQGYSEEEVLEHLNHLIMMPSSELDKFTDDEEMVTMKWFEQFKKK